MRSKGPSQRAVSEVAVESLHTSTHSIERDVLSKEAKAYLLRLDRSEPGARKEPHKGEPYRADAASEVEQPRLRRSRCM